MVDESEFLIEDVVMRNEEGPHPIFVKFANGWPNNSEKLTGKIKVKTHKKTQNIERTLKIETPEMEYKGSENSTLPKKLLTFVGFVDKRTGKMKLYETSFFEVQPQLPRWSPPEENLEKTREEAKVEFRKKQEQLAKNFGTKRYQKAMTKIKEENSLQSGSTQSKSTATLSAAVKNIASQHNHRDVYSAFLPPHDFKATKLHEVYPLDGIVSDFELMQLQKQAEEVLEMKDELMGVSDLFKFLVEVSLKHPKSCLHRVCVALYVEYLLVFIDMTPKQLRNGVSIQFCPPFLQKKFQNNFMECFDNRWERNATMLHKSRCYAIVAAFICADYELPVDKVSNSITMKNELLHSTMHVIRASPKNNKAKYQIKFPLTTNEATHKSSRRGPRRN